MANRKESLVTGEYYHIYNRGVDKRDIFTEEDDLNRFLESVLIFNQVESTKSVRDQHELHGVKNFNSPEVGLLGKGCLVEIVSICTLPNHFHILLKQKVDGGISEFMRRLMGGYTKYFNSKYNRSGSLFQGKFKSKLCNEDLYFKLLFCYVTFNFRVHNISKEKLKFVKSSWDEYASKKFCFIAKSEAELVLSLFGDLSKIVKYAKDAISIIRKKRDKNELDGSDFEID